MNNTQLTSASGYDVNNMIFSEPQSGSVPNSKIAYQRINITTRNPDGTVGDLILPTEKVFSFGVSENTDVETGKVNGYVMPLCLWNRDNTSEEEKEWSDTFNNIVEHCKNHLVEHKDEIGQFDLELNDLKKFNPLYWKRDKANKNAIVEGTGPTLYAKLIVSKKNGDRIVSMFFDQNDNPVDPLELLGKYCLATAAIKIESIFIGNKISLQVKLYEATVELLDSGMRKLLPRPQASNSNVVDETGVDEGDVASDSGSLVEDTPAATPPPPSPPKKKVVKKVVAKKKA